MPFLLIIPLMVWTLSGGQTRLRLWRHVGNCKALSRSFQVQLCGLETNARLFLPRDKILVSN
jgi:hypothetical protein